MKAIYKFPLVVQDNNAVEMPEEAMILCVQMQHGNPCIWAEVDTEKPKVTRNFQIYGTGHAMSDAYLDYIGTFQMHGGNLVFHLFEKLT